MLTYREEFFEYLREWYGEDDDAVWESLEVE